MGEARVFFVLLTAGLLGWSFWRRAAGWWSFAGGELQRPGGGRPPAPTPAPPPPPGSEAPQARADGAERPVVSRICDERAARVGAHS